jgi:hypothetical protein
MAVIGVLTLLLVAVAVPAQADPPDQSGVVMRGDDILAVFSVDEKAGLSAVLGGEVAVFCAGIIDFDVIPFQRVDVPEDVNRVIDLFKGEVRTEVYDVTFDVFSGFPCDLFEGVEPLATGMSRVVLTGSDVNAFDNPDNRNRNAFGWQAHGKLDGADGTR